MEQVNTQLADKILFDDYSVFYEMRRTIILPEKQSWERSGSVVECLTRDRRAAGSSLTGVTALCP